MTAPDFCHEVAGWPTFAAGILTEAAPSFRGSCLVPQVRAPVLGANLGEGKSEALLRAPSVPGRALSTPIRSLRSQSPETHNGGGCSTSNPRALKLAHVSPDFDEGNATSPRTPDGFSRFDRSISSAKILRTSPGIVGFADVWRKTASSSG